MIHQQRIIPWGVVFLGRNVFNKNEHFPGLGFFLMASSGKTKLAVKHFVLKGNRIQPPFPKGTETCVFGTGCFWGSVGAVTEDMKFALNTKHMQYGD